jgi:MFS family permease
MDKITFTNLSSSTKRNVVYAFLLDFSLRPELNLAIWSYFVRGELGFTQTQALLLSWGAFIIHIIMEIPTGAFADRFSRKTAILIGVFCILLARGSWLAFDGFVVIAIAQVIGGLGSSFASGAYDAIVHDSIAKDIGNSNNTQIESIYSKYLGRKNAVFFVARVTLGLIGAWLFTVNVYLPYWGALIFVAFAGVLAMLLHEEKTDHHKNKQYIKKAVNHVCKNTALLTISVIWFELFNCWRFNIFTNSTLWFFN